MRLGNSICWWITCGLIAALVVLMVIALIPITLNYNGFCFKESRFLTDQEKYRIVVERIVQNGNPFQPVKPLRPGRTYWSPQEGDTISHWVIEGHDGAVEPIPYRSADEFFAKNPNCCEMRPFFESSEGSFMPDFWDRALGDCSGGVVRVTNIARFRDQAGIEREITHTGDSLLSNCGRSLTVPTLK